MSAIPAQSGKHLKYFDDRKLYPEFIALLRRSKNVAFENMCRSVQLKIVQWLHDKHEVRAATWFSTHWTGEKGAWMLGLVGLNAAITNNGMESNWRDLKMDCRPLQWKLHLNEFLSALWVHLELKSANRMYQMTEYVDPYNFPSAPQPNCAIWDEVQRWNPDMLVSATLVDGNDARWKQFTESLQCEMRCSSDKLFVALQRMHVQGRIPFALRDIKKLHVPDSKFLYQRKSRDCMGDYIDEIQTIGIKYGEVLNQEPQVRMYCVEETLYYLESHHEVSVLSTPWSDIQHFKCTCPTCHRNGICDHAIIVSMLLNPGITVPPQYIRAVVVGRRKRGRPRADPTLAEPRKKINFDIITSLDPPTEPKSPEANEASGEDGEHGAPIASDGGREVRNCYILFHGVIHVQLFAGPAPGTTSTSTRSND